MKWNLCLLIIVFLWYTGCSNPEVSGERNEPVSFYELRIYEAEPGKMNDLHARFRDHTLALFAEHGMTGIGYWVPVQNPESHLYFILGYPDRQAREAAWQAFRADPRWLEAREASEVRGPLVKSIRSVFLKPTDYSPPVSPAIEVPPRIFEFREYISTPGNLDRLHARFRDHTLGLFSRHGIRHFGYWSPVDSDQGAQNTLIYLMSHVSVESREASFAAFRADPDWLEARAASESEAGESLTERVDAILMQATDYSPTR